MRMELHILGTSSARPAHGREVSGAIISLPNHQVAVDCGEGFQARLHHHGRRLRKMEWPTRLAHTRVDVLALTHGHLDHSWGALPMLQSMALDDRTRPLAIVGPTSVDAYWALFNGGTNADLPDALHPADIANHMRIWWQMGVGGGLHDWQFEITWYLVAWPNGAESWLRLHPESGEVVALEGPPTLVGDNWLTPHPTSHTVPSCAWRLRSAEKEGRFDGAKAEELGLSHTQVSELASGVDIVGPEGAQLPASDFRGESRPGRSILISGDTGENAPGLLALGDEELNPHSLDLMVHEATYLDSHQEKARLYQHSTSRNAGSTATQAGARHLVLTHFSSRLKTVDESLAQARQEHPAVAAASDGDVFVLNDKGSVSHFRIDGEVLSELKNSFQ